MASQFQPITTNSIPMIITARFKKSKVENKDGTRNTIVREDNNIRVYNVNGQKVSDQTFSSNAAARREMANA